MGAHGGPNMTEDGVVFYYDTGNSKSYAGEPTTNFMPNIYIAGSNVTSGTDEIGDYFEGDITRIGCPNGTSINSGSTYTFTIEIRSNRTFNMSADSNQYAPENAGNDANRISVSYILPNYTTPNEWEKYSTTVVMKTGLTNPTMFDFFIPVSFSGRLYYRNAQLEYKPHATQYVDGTRSVTEGLKDFTGNSTIDITNVSFDSNAQIEFDGTDDYANVGDSAIFNFTSALTIELWTYVTSFDAGGCMFICQQNGTTYGGFEFWSQTSGAIRFNSNSSDNIAASPSGTFELNKWQHLVCTADGTTGKIYVNGELVATNSAGLPDNVNGDLRIGDWPLAGYRVNGSIPVVKMYNRALTSEEVAENFNGIRSRFGI